jgi:N-formylglutamate deformylase
VTAPFTVFRPKALTSLIYDSPHSGRYYPPSWKTLASHDELRLGEDAYVDELLETSVELGATLLIDNYPRCFIDVNREESDIDPELLAEDWPEPLAPSEKSRKGLGLIRRFVVPGVVVNAEPLSNKEIRQRIQSVYRPYHEALSDLIAEVRQTHGKVMHVDWHSMKSKGNAMTPDGPGASRPDFVVSDGHGTTSGQELVNTIVVALEDCGYSVSVNEPYSGGTIVKRYGRPHDRVDSVQIEINRALYLEESTVELNDGFNVLKRDIEHLTSVLIDNEH